MRAIICLGNPGPEYHATRHNVGFLVADYLAARHDVDLRRRRLRSIFGRGKIAGQDVLLVKPQTFMNDSGDAARRMVQFFKIDQPDVLVVYDDMALDVGVLRVRRGGSDAGHKGMRSVAAHLGTRDIARLRLGVGGPPEGISGRDWVLSAFKPSEREPALDMDARAARAVAMWTAEGLDAVMNEFNG